MVERELFLNEIEDKGFSVVRNVINQDTVSNLIKELKIAIDKEVEYHGSIDYKDYGNIQAIPMYSESFLNILDNKDLIEPYNMVLDDGCIIYVYMSSSLPPNGRNFATRIHVDRPRLIQGFKESFNGLILLSDFTIENGATYLLPGSHKLEEMPDEKYFYENAVRLTAKAGDVFYFDPRLWHAAGVNNTNEWRYAIAIGMVRPYLKQKFDIPKMLENKDLSNLSDYALQKLGLFSIPPSSLDEYYGPVEKRTYTQKSEWDR